VPTAPVPGSGVEFVLLPAPLIGVCVAPPTDDVPSVGALEPLLDEQATPAPITSAAIEIDVCRWVIMTPRGNHPALTFSGLTLEGAKKLSLSACTWRSRCAQFRRAAFICSDGISIGRECRDG
jgi:hypothetical protein